MNEIDHALRFKKLFSTITTLFNNQKFINADVDELADIFYENLSEMMQITLDIQVSLKDIRKFVKEYGKDADDMTLAGFIAGHLENEKSYIILNYFLCEFLQSLYSVVKPDMETYALDIMIKNEISENELESIIKKYKKLFNREKIIYSNS